MPSFSPNLPMDRGRREEEVPGRQSNKGKYGIFNKERDN
jgi:hypothetical protein